MGGPQWAEEAKFGTALARWHNRHELDELIGNWTSQHDDLELARRLQGLGIAAGSALTAQDLVNDLSSAGTRLYVGVLQPSGPCRWVPRFRRAPLQRSR